MIEKRSVGVLLCPERHFAGLDFFEKCNLGCLFRLLNIWIDYVHRNRQF